MKNQSGFTFTPRLRSSFGGFRTTWSSSKRSGFTLIELLVVIAVIGLLASVVMVSLNSARGKARFTRALADMKQIATAGALVADDRGGDYEADGGWCNAPSTFVPKYMSSWPKGPCPGWGYDWEHWGSIVRITLRGGTCGDGGGNVGPSIYYYCLTPGNCSPADGIDIMSVTDKSLQC